MTVDANERGLEMPQPTPKPERRAGFTIVEALVALTIFGIGTILLMQLAPRAVQYATRARVLSQANALAQAKVEELRALPQLHADLTAGAHQDPNNPIDGTFTRTWDVTEDECFPEGSIPSTAPDPGDAGESVDEARIAQARGEAWPPGPRYRPEPRGPGEARRLWWSRGTLELSWDSSARSPC